MKGFRPPEYTMTPNKFFDELLPELGYAELKVLLCIFRQTFGWHRPTVKMSVRKIAKATGLSAHHTFDAGVALEARGLVRKVSTLGESTEWEILFEGVTLGEQPITLGEQGVHPAKSKLPVKESKEIKRKDPASRPLDILDAILFYEKPAMSIRQALTDYFKMNVNWDTKTARQWMEWAIGTQITSEQIKGAAEVWRTDKRFNWSAPTLQKIFEQWPALMGESIAEADPIYHAGIIELPAEPMTPEELRFIFGDAPHA